MKHLTALAIGCLTLAATPVAAQQVGFRGKVEDVSGTMNQFFVDCTNVELTSSAVVLQNFVGEQVEFTGNWNGSTTSPSVDVTALTVVAENFEIGGGGQLGSQFSFEVVSTPGDRVIIFASTGFGFQPVGPGVALLDLAELQRVGTGIVPGLGVLQINVTIPNDLSLVGIEVHGQSVIDKPGAGGLELTTTDCKTIRT